MSKRQKGAAYIGAGIGNVDIMRPAGDIAVMNLYVRGAATRRAQERLAMQEKVREEQRRQNLRSVRAVWGNQVGQAPCQSGNMEDAIEAVAQLALYRAGKPSSLREGGMRGRTSPEEMTEKLAPSLLTVANCGKCAVTDCEFKPELVVFDPSQRYNITPEQE